MPQTIPLKLIRCSLKSLTGQILFAEVHGVSAYSAPHSRKDGASFINYYFCFVDQQGNHAHSWAREVPRESLHRILCGYLSLREDVPFLGLQIVVHWAVASSASNRTDWKVSFNSVSNWFGDLLTVFWLYSNTKIQKGMKRF
jgi:hypothetical protein